MEHVGSPWRASWLEGRGPRRQRSACHQWLSHACRALQQLQNCKAGEAYMRSIYAVHQRQLRPSPWMVSLASITAVDLRARLFLCPDMLVTARTTAHTIKRMAQSLTWRSPTHGAWRGTTGGHREGQSLLRHQGHEAMRRGHAGGRKGHGRHLWRHGHALELRSSTMLASPPL